MTLLRILVSVRKDAEVQRLLSPLGNTTINITTKELKAKARALGQA